MVALLQIICVILKLTHFFFSDFPIPQRQTEICCQHSTWMSQNLFFWQIRNKSICHSYVSL